MGLQVPVNLPAGSVSPFAGTTAPEGWLLMYGQAISRVTYAALFLAIGTTYGAGDGVNTFNLPDVRGRALFGRDDMGGAAANRLTTGGGGLNGTALGAVGGGETKTLTEAQVPSHQHVQSSDNVGGVFTATIGAGSSSQPSAMPQPATATNKNATLAAIKAKAAGSSGAHSVIPPGLVLNYIIKT